MAFFPFLGVSPRAKKNISRMDDIILNQASYIRAAQRIANDPNLLSSEYYNSQLGPIFDRNKPMWEVTSKIKQVAKLDSTRFQTNALLNIFKDWFDEDEKSASQQPQSAVQHKKENIARMNDIILNQSSYIRAAQRIANDPNLLSSEYFNSQLGPIFDSNRPMWKVTSKIERIAKLDYSRDQTDALLEIFKDWFDEDKKSAAQQPQQAGRQPAQQNTAVQPTQSAVQQQQPQDHQSVRQNTEAKQISHEDITKRKEFLLQILSFSSDSKNQELLRDFELLKGCSELVFLKDEIIHKANQLYKFANPDLGSCLTLVNDVIRLSFGARTHASQGAISQMSQTSKMRWSECDKLVLDWEKCFESQNAK